MSTISKPEALLGPDDLLSMPDRKDYELVNGTLRELGVSALSSLVAMTLVNHLLNFISPRKLGWLFGPDCGFVIGPRTVRKPDISVVRAERLPAGQIGAGWVTMAPDLAVEVISPNDSAQELDAKVEQLLEAGTRLLWVVNPTLRTVRVYRADRSVALLRSGEVLDGEDVLPGFRCEVKALFPMVEIDKS
jgi:Uma2 family endonuclease